MKTCPETKALLPDYLEGQLPAAMVSEVQSHLQACPECSAELEIEKQLRELLATMPLIACPAEVNERILAHIVLEPTGRAAGKSQVPWRALTVLAAACLALFVFWTRPETADQPQAAGPTEPPSAAEVEIAGQEARWALAQVAIVLSQHEATTIDQVFGRVIPDAVTGSLIRITKNLQGDV